MTPAEQNLSDDKMRAEIAELIAETHKTNSERFWIPFTVFGGVVVAVATVMVKLTG